MKLILTITFLVFLIFPAMGTGGLNFDSVKTNTNEVKLVPDKYHILDLEEVISSGVKITSEELLQQVPVTEQFIQEIKIANTTQEFDFDDVYIRVGNKYVSRYPTYLLSRDNEDYFAKQQSPFTKLFLSISLGVAVFVVFTTLYITYSNIISND